MPATQIRGSTQILDGTITAAKLVSGLNLPTSQLQDGADFIRRTGSVAWTADQSHGGFKITNLGTPTVGTDAATKAYVDSVSAGLDPKGSVRAVAIANVASLSGEQTVDGVSLVAGDRVLITAQSTASQNGIWVVAAGAWTRPSDYTGAATATGGAFVFVEEGTTNSDTGWVLTTNGAVTVDTTSTTWTQFSGGGTILAGTGLTKTGSTLSFNIGDGLENDGSNNIRVKLNGASLERTASGVRITPGTAGQVMISNATPAPTFASLSGDVSSVSGAGAVTLATGIMRKTNFVRNETPSGTINGSNVAFTLAGTPVSGTEAVYQNGVRLRPGAGNDYTISGGTITFVTAPLSGDVILVDYLN